MYTIKVLSNKEFEALPYKHLKESYGIADKKKGVAFVRDMGMDRTGPAVAHEMEELISQFSDHEDEDGMRHGWFNDTFGFSSQPWAKAIAPILGATFLGPMGAGLGAAAANLTQGEKIDPMYVGASALGGYLGTNSPGFKAGVANSAAEGGGWFGQGLSGLQGLAFGTAGTQSIAGGGTDATKGLLGFGGKLGGAAPYVGKAADAVGGAGGLVAGGGGQGLSNPLTLLGLGSMALGSMPTNVPAPQIGSTASKWLTADTVTKAGEMAKEIGDVEYLGDFAPSQETLAMIDIQQKDIDKSYKQRIEQLDKSMSATNTSWARSGERLEMIRRINDEKEEQKISVQKEWLATAEQEHSVQQYNYIMNQLNIDNQTKQDLLYADIADLTNQYNIEYADAMRFRDLASKAGLYMAASGLGIT